MLYNEGEKFISNSIMGNDELIDIRNFCNDRQISIPTICIAAFKILLLKYQYEPEKLSFQADLLFLEDNDRKSFILHSLDKTNITTLEICNDLQSSIISLSEFPVNSKIYKAININFSLTNEDKELNNDLNIEITLNDKFEILVFSKSNSKYFVTSNHSAEHYRNIINQIITKADKSINEFEILSINEKKLLENYSYGVYNPEISNPTDLIEIFNNTVAKYSENTAINFKNKSITYSQLNSKSDKLAEKLKINGSESGKFIGILMKRSIDTFISMIAILKSGNAYIPLDPSYPIDRINYILNDCSAEYLITKSDFNINEINEQNPNCKIIIYKDEDENFNNELKDNLNINIENKRSNLCNQLAYAIYTSGTTGVPKGVKISHSSICNLIKAESLIYNIQPDDRILQGFSIAFDASLEEIWMAFFSGASLVIASEEVMKSGPEITTFLNENKVSIFSTVPTLLSILEEDVPTLKLLILGGEVCTKELISSWLNGTRRIINTYGPTEATVVASYFECEIGKEVTIGKPLNNYSMYILDSELNELPVGIPGEILIGGLSLSEGYINREDLNRSNFIEPNFKLNPNFPNRLYKTGDIGRFNSLGDIEYLGRIDNQVKIRGYRVELSEIESQLLLCPGINSVAVVVKKGLNDVQILIAYIIKSKDNSYNEKITKDLIRTKLPSFMIPSSFIYLDEFPTLPSGKTDRKMLPDPVFNEIDDQQDTSNYTETEKKILSVWKRLFSINTIKLTDDFFELGGHSLLAAQMISELRKDSATSKLSVHDIYTYLTIEKLSNYIDSTKDNLNDSAYQNNTEREKKIKKVSKIEYFSVFILQTISIFLFYGLISTFVMLPIIIGKFFNFNDFQFYVMTICTLLSSFIVLLILSIIIKWVVIGKFKEGEYPLWSLYYFRFWFVKKFVDFVPLSLLSGSPFLNIYYKLMGAKIGKNVFSGSDRIRAFDLVSIGDYSSISREAYIMGYTIEDGMLRIGKITIGENCFIGPRSLLSINSVMEPYSSLLELSMLPESQNIKSGDIMKGSPAQFHNKRDDYKEKDNFIRSTKEELSTFTSNLLFFFAALLVFSLPLIIALPIAEYLFILEESHSYAFVFLMTIPSAAIYVIVFCLVVAALKWLILGKQKPKDIPVKSNLYIRKWIIDTLLQLNLLMLKSIYATIFLPYWFRLMGAKIGKRAEISTVNHISLDMLEIGEESFIADSVNVGAPLVFNGKIKFRTTYVGKRTFIGNSAVLPTGSSVADNSLIGVLSIPPESDNINDHEGSSWLGSPPMFLPNRDKSYKFPEELTYNPSLKLYLIRGTIEFFKITLPYAFEILLFGAFYILTLEIVNLNNIPETLVLSMFIFAFLSLLSPIIAYLLKKIIVNKYIKDVKPLWSYFVWKNEFINSICENFVYPFFQNVLLGTPYASLFFRLMGCKIGKNVFLDTTEITEFDLVEIGDNCSLNFGCTIQTHLFEDRVMKMSNINIGNNCNVGPLSVVLYDTQMEDNSSILGLSLLMKGETLPKNTVWQGSPVKFSHKLK